MFTNILSLEFISLTLIIGIGISTLIRKYRGVNPGGIITPSLLLLSFIKAPIIGLTIIALSYFVYKIYKTFFTHVYHARFPMYIKSLISILSMFNIMYLYKTLNWVSKFNLDALYGLLLPAIIASAITKQGCKKTYLYLLLSFILTTIATFSTYFLCKLLFHYDFNYIEKISRHNLSYDLDNGLLIIFISVIISLLIYMKTKVKSGGYIVIPYIAFLLFRPINLVLFFLILLLIYGIIKIIQKNTLIIGITRYSLVLSISIITVWFTELLGITLSQGRFSIFLGANALPALTLASVVNDFSVQKAKRTYPLFLLNICLVFIVIYIIDLLLKVH